MAAKKKAQPAKKTPSQTPTRPGKFGGSLRSGNPGNKGGGRPPNWLKDWCDELLADKDSKQQVQDILKNKDHPAFTQMWKAVADRAHGKAKEHVEHSVDSTLAALLEESMK